MKAIGTDLQRLVVDIARNITGFHEERRLKKTGKHVPVIFQSFLSLLRGIT